MNVEITPLGSSFFKELQENSSHIALFEEVLDYDFEGYGSVESPYSGELISRLPFVTEKGVHDKINSLYNASHCLSVEDRVSIAKSFGRYLRKNIRALAKLTALESGIPKSHIKIRLDFVTGRFEECDKYIDAIYGNPKILDGVPFKVGSSEGKAYIRKLPKGIFLLNAPNNESVGVTLQNTLELLLGGNKVLVKPGSYMPLGTTWVINELKSSGFEGYVDVINGSGKSVLDTAVTCKNLRGVLFVGRSEHGSYIHSQCAKHWKDFIGEYEGNNPIFILEDIKPSVAAFNFILGTSVYNGLACFAIKWGSYEGNPTEFLNRLVGMASKLRYGDPTDSKTEIGPLPTEKLAQECVGYINDAKSKGATILSGGELLENTARDDCQANLLEYTLLTDISKNMKISRNETPGPVCWFEPDFVKAENFAFANECGDAEGQGYGLRTIISTKNYSKFMTLVTKFRSGSVSNTPFGMDVLQPWGGTFKSCSTSGFRYLLDEGLDSQYLLFGGKFEKLIEELYDNIQPKPYSRI